MTPDDIRYASFDSVRKGFDPEQVRDLLARVAFLLDRRPDIDLSELLPTEPEPIFSFPNGVAPADPYTGTIVMTRPGAAAPVVRSAPETSDDPPDDPYDNLDDGGAGDSSGRQLSGSDRVRLADRIDELLAATQELAQWRRELAADEAPPTRRTGHPSRRATAERAPAERAPVAITRPNSPTRTDPWGAASTPWFVDGAPRSVGHATVGEPSAESDRPMPSSALAAALAAVQSTGPVPLSVVPGLDRVQETLGRATDSARHG